MKKYYTINSKYTQTVNVEFIVEPPTYKRYFRAYKHHSSIFHVCSSSAIQCKIFSFEAIGNNWSISIKHRWTICLAGWVEDDGRIGNSSRIWVYTGRKKKRGFAQTYEKHLQNQKQKRKHTHCEIGIYATTELSMCKNKNTTHTHTHTYKNNSNRYYWIHDLIVMVIYVHQNPILSVQ